MNVEKETAKKIRTKQSLFKLFFAFLKIFVLNQLLVGMVERDFL